MGQFQNRSFSDLAKNQNSLISLLNINKNKNRSFSDLKNENDLFLLYFLVFLFSLYFLQLSLYFSGLALRHSIALCLYFSLLAW